MSEGGPRTRGLDVVALAFVAAFLDGAFCFPQVFLSLFLSPALTAMVSSDSLSLLTSLPLHLPLSCRSAICGI